MYEIFFQFCFMNFFLKLQFFACQNVSAAYCIDSILKAFRSFLGEVTAQQFCFEIY